MANRAGLDTMLKNTAGAGVHVYFQPPKSIQLVYPAIVYSRKRIDNRYADNVVYNQRIGYDVVVIDRDPDSQIVTAISMLPYCSHNNSYARDGLNHDAFTIYY